MRFSIAAQQEAFHRPHHAAAQMETDMRHDLLFSPHRTACAMLAGLTTILLFLGVVTSMPLA